MFPRRGEVDVPRGGDDGGLPVCFVCIWPHASSIAFPGAQTVYSPSPSKHFLPLAATRQDGVHPE